MKISGVLNRYIKKDENNGYTALRVRVERGKYVIQESCKCTI